MSHLHIYLHRASPIIELRRVVAPREKQKAQAHLDALLEDWVESSGIRPEFLSDEDELVESPFRREMDFLRKYEGPLRRFSDHNPRGYFADYKVPSHEELRQAIQMGEFARAASTLSEALERMRERVREAGHELRMKLTVTPLNDLRFRVPEDESSPIHDSCLRLQPAG